jgi:hypothetical protein
MPVRQQGERSDRVDAPERDIGARVIIEDARTVPDQPRPEPVHLPLPGLQEHPRRVERTSEVRPFSDIDEPSRAVLHFLPAGPKGQGVRVVFTPTPREVDERLMGIEDVAVDVRAGTADQSRLEPALELTEDADVRPEVQVGVQQVALDEVVVVPMAVGGCAPEEGVLIELEAGTGRTAERQVIIVPPAQGDVLQDVEPVGPAAGVLEIAVVLVVAEQLVFVEIGSLRRLATGSQASPRARWGGCVGPTFGRRRFRSSRRAERRGPLSGRTGDRGESRAQRQEDDPNRVGCSARRHPRPSGPLTANSGVSSPVIGDGEPRA